MLATLSFLMFMLGVWWQDINFGLSIGSFSPEEVEAAAGATCVDYAAWLVDCKPARQVSLVYQQFRTRNGQVVDDDFFVVAFL